MNFVAIDVETANSDVSSICQIGIVHFENGEIVDTWCQLVNPHDYFDPINEQIHGITEKDVRNSPDYLAISNEINQRTQGRVVAAHTGFDKASVTKAALKNNVNAPECTWLNTASVARRAWPEVAQKGYGLTPLAARLGIEFKHHNAAEDARAAGIILLRAMSGMNLDLDGCIKRVEKPLNPLYIQYSKCSQSGAIDGVFHGEVVVFTGVLTIARSEAAHFAALAGCDVADGVTKHTTLLVVGEQDIRALKGHTKSSKHLKAEDLIAKGQPIRIITESDFLTMLK